jgi:hypothetical protein
MLPSNARAGGGRAAPDFDRLCDGGSAALRVVLKQGSVALRLSKAGVETRYFRFRNRALLRRPQRHTARRFIDVLSGVAYRALTIVLASAE